MDELCDECVCGSSSDGEEEEDEYDPQPLTSCAGAQLLMQLLYHSFPCKSLVGVTSRMS